MKKTAYRAGRIQVQGTLKIGVFSHINYRETLARKRFWAVLWRLAKFSRLLAQPLCWNDKTRSFRNASSRSEIHFLLQTVQSSVKIPLVNSFSHLYSKSIFASSRSEIHLFVSPKCEKVGSIRHLPSTKVSDFGIQWVCVAAREFAWTNRPPPISKTLVMVQGDPTRTHAQVLLIDDR